MFQPNTISKGIFIGDDTLVNYFEPVGKIANQIWLTKQCGRTVVTTITRKTKKVPCCIFFMWLFSRRNAGAEGHKCYRSVLLRC